MTDDDAALELLATAAVGVLRERGPLTDEAWARALVDTGHGTHADMLDLVGHLDNPVLGYLPDGRNTTLDTLLEGRILTHRLTAPEIAADILDAEADLLPMAAYVPLGAAGADGFTSIMRGHNEGVFAQRGVADPGWPAGEALAMGRGALGGYREGDVVGLTVAGGHLALVPVAGGLAAPDLAGPLGAVVAPDTQEEFTSALWQVMADDPAAFTTPALPLGELLAAAGYDHDGEWLAASGFDFERHRGQRHLEAFAAHYDLEPHEAAAVLAFTQLAQRPGDGDVAAFVTMAAPLADPWVARAALHEAYVAQAAGVGGLQAAADLLLAWGSHRLAPAALWLSGRVAELDGQTDLAEQFYERATTADPRFEPAVLALGRFASDRGDAARALTLLERTSEGPDEPVYGLVKQFAAAAEHPGLGRNDRCWCGSGRKYKVCHLGKPATAPLDDRALWLYRKAQAFAEDLDWVPTVVELIERQAGADHGREAAGGAAREGLAVDLALFEGGAFADFLARRGHLLPADEQLLAQQWLPVRRSVHEVLAARPGGGLALRDTRTGDTCEVPEPEAGHQLRAGQLLCARVVPAGSAMRILGWAEPVDPGRRGALAALLDDEGTTPEELADFLGARSAPS